MLSKLLKYEIKATARIFLPLYAVLLTYAIIHKVISVINPYEMDAPEAISFFIYIMIIMGIFVTTLVVTIQRFYKNLLSDEGYLMFTLPTKAWKHIVSKLAVSMLWSAVSGIVAILSVLIIAYEKIFTRNSMGEINEVIKNVFNNLGPSTALVIMEIILAVIIGLAASVLIIYASMAVGHLFSRHRILASLGAFIALNTVSRIIATLYAIPFARPISVRYSEGDFNINAPVLELGFLFIIILSGILSAGYFIITNYILSRRLNLE